MITLAFIAAVLAAFALGLAVQHHRNGRIAVEYILRD